MFLVFIFTLCFLEAFCIDCPKNTSHISDSSTHTSYCVYFSSNSTDFKNAELICNNLTGGHLVSIHNSYFLTVFVHNAEHKINNSDMWVGLSKNNPYGIWEWTDGTLFNFDHWIDDETPNITSPNCTAMAMHNGLWTAQSCSFTKPFACIVSPLKNMSVVNCTNVGITFLEAGEFIKFESTNYPSLASYEPDYLTCYNKFKRKDNESNIWFVLLNSKILQFDITGTSINATDYERETIIWDKQPLWFSSLIEWPELEFHINDDIAVPLEKTDNWKGFQALVYAPISLKDNKHNFGCPLDGIEYKFLSTYDIFPISSSFYFANEVKNDIWQQVECKWNFSISSGYMFKVHIRVINISKFSELKILLDNNTEIQVSNPSVYYLKNKRISISYTMEESLLTSDFGFGGIVTAVEINPDFGSQCVTSFVKNTLQFQYYDETKGYQTNNKCIKKISMIKGQTFQLDYYGYLEDNVDKFEGERFLNTYFGKQF